MSEHPNEPHPTIDLSDVAEDPVRRSVDAEKDVVAGEPGSDSLDEGGTVPEDDAQ
jgi:hypothetical protein